MDYKMNNININLFEIECARDEEHKADYRKNNTNKLNIRNLISENNFNNTI